MLSHAPAIDAHELPAPSTAQETLYNGNGEENGTPLGNNSDAQTSMPSSVPGAVAVREIDTTDDDDDFLAGKDQRGSLPHAQHAQMVQSEEAGLFEDLAEAELVLESDLVKQERGVVSWIKRHKIVSAIVSLVVVRVVVGSIVGATNGGGRGGGVASHQLLP